MYLIVIMSIKRDKNDYKISCYVPESSLLAVADQ